MEKNIYTKKIAECVALTAACVSGFEIDLALQEEISMYLAEAAKWAENFDNRADKDFLVKVPSWLKAVQKLRKHIPSQYKKVHTSLEETEVNLKYLQMLKLSSKAMRHVRPYDHVKKDGTPSINKMIDSLAKNPNLVVRDTLEKPLNNFLHTTNKLLKNKRGKRIFLGFVFQEAVAPYLSRSIRNSVDEFEPADIFNTFVSPRIAKARLKRKR